MAGNVYETERLVGRSPPMLKSVSEFSNWKIQMKAYFRFTEHILWDSIVKDPHIPHMINANGLVPIVDPDQYLEEDKKLIERDNRALGSIILALPTELYLNFEQHEISQGLWNALCLRLGKMGVELKECDVYKKLLDSLHDIWSIPCMLIKNTTSDLRNKTLNDIICLLESYEREMNNPEKSHTSSSANAALFSGSGEGSSGGSKTEKGKGCCRSENVGSEKSKAAG
ncbi:hypothetical protein L1987_08849 [Smallanthus sonchifolius]|uniref:Uncharacterized protein n=1 Tax=Smallanthus sonchifolius TaxID=185202 RepID=A0ACB9JNX8_9ASTR|nr:hypothetical protein L1987_08849 [Smallanthus sonchifolius]